MFRKRPWLKWSLLAALIGAVLACAAGEHFFNLNSNLVLLTVRDSTNTLRIRLKRGAWKMPTDLTPADLAAAQAERHEENGLRWTTLRVNREAGVRAKVVQALFGPEVHIVTISPERFDFMTSFQPKFALTTAEERMDSENLWFTVTANFRDPKGRPMGWVYHDGVRVNAPFGEWSGCFFVKGGKPWAGPKSLLDEVPGAIDEGVQVYPAVMKNHTIFPYIEMKPDEFFDGSKITYRSLMGMRRDGTIVFVLSGDGGLMNVAEISEIARKLDVQHATLLDGGRALQYSIRTADGPWHFAAFNTRLPFTRETLEQQRSPIYIGVRRKAPEVLTTQR
jgi:uncharacterized protein YigE (DUF2233 family)